MDEDEFNSLADGSWQYEIEQLRAENEALQAKIDRLMLEYCPDEMTDEQMANWARHQRPVSAEQEAAIDAAMKEEK